MRVYLNILCEEIPESKRNAMLELPDSATVDHALDRYSEEYIKTPILANRKRLVILVNAAPSGLNSMLCENDTVTVMKLTTGG